MRHSFWTAAGVLVAAAAAPAAPAVDADDLRPGLIATHANGQHVVTLVEPAPGYRLAAGEAAHPRLKPEGVSRWQGYVNLFRAGPYTFAAAVRGRVAVTVGSHLMLEAGDGSTVGPPVELKAGVHAITVEFFRSPGPAELELTWEGPGFRREPFAGEFLGHLAAEAAVTRPHALAERGRFLAEELSCTKCHGTDGSAVAAGLQPRVGPDLTTIGARAYPGWIDRWLADPHALRPGTVMPKLFADDETGRAERYAVARYLSSLGGPLKPADKPKAKDHAASVNRGRATFAATGCAACHQNGVDPAKEPADPLYGLGTPDGVHFNYPLGPVGSKYRPDGLAAYLKNPLAVNPSGRMPSMNLDGKEAADLAAYLCEDVDGRAPNELPTAPDARALAGVWERLKAEPSGKDEDGQWRAAGKLLLVEKGCVNCHAVAPGGKALAAKPPVKPLAAVNGDAGCLSAEVPPAVPRFKLTDGDRAALRAVLKGGLTGAGSPAPVHAARVAFKRFNCLNCHQRDGGGGLSAKLVEEMRRYEKPENAEALAPPTLTGVGHKLLTPWLKQVLVGGGRARPWMGLRMPQYGEANVGFLADALAACEGAAADGTVHRVETTPAKVGAGRNLIGKGGFGCISCHDIAGVANSGTRGPDLATTNQRVRYDWYRRWLEQPQRMQPGTKMPQLYPGGKSMLPAVLNGSADAQSEAMWAYLSLGPSMPLPEGLEPPKGLVVAVRERAEVLRTFLPEAGSKALAVGFPNGVSAAFDAHACRLAYGWSGNFLDATPVWANRGGAPAKLLGPKFWEAPAGNPWAVTAGEVPDFPARAKDPAYGGAVPEGKWFAGPPALHFEGYRADTDGVPTFRYRLDAGTGGALAVAERVTPLRSAVGVGLARHFALEVPAGRAAWLYAGDRTKTPRLFDAAGAAVPFDPKGKAEVPAAGRLLVLPQGGGRTVALSVAAAPDGTVWHLEPHNGAWLALVKLPATAAPAKAELRLNVWSVTRDEPGFLRELAAAK